MNATELFKAGKLREAVDAQIQEVKSKPAEQGARVFLFELLCFSGDLDRAQKQIDAVRYDEVEREMAVHSYRKLLDAERLRRRLFAEGLQPKFLVDPPEHVKLRLEALNCLRGKQSAQVAELLTRADDATPEIGGQVNGKTVDMIRDCDDVFGPVVEVMAHGDYFWVPIEQIGTLAMNAPQAPRDLLWAPARLEVREGPAGDVFLPVLYQGSHEHADEQVKLGRMTDWSDPAAGPVRGMGLRMFLCGDEAMSVLEWRQVQINE